MSVRSDIEILQLFNEKADKLESLSFKTKMMRDKTGVTITYEQGKEVVAERFGPDVESIDAFLFTFRFFIQDNEPTSLHNMSKLYAALPVSSELIENFNKAREGFNSFLDSATPVKSGEHRITYRHVMYTLLWGDLAHTANKYKERRDWLRRNPAAFKLLENFFTVVLALGLKTILYIRELNKTAIEELSQGIHATK